MSRDIKWGPPQGVINTLGELSGALEQLRKVAGMQRDEAVSSLEKAANHLRAEVGARDQNNKDLKEKQAAMDKAFADYRRAEDK